MLIKRNLPFLKTTCILYSILATIWLYVTVYLWLDLCYGALVGDVYYVKPYHLPIIYSLVYGVMSAIRIWETKVMMSWSKYGS